MAFYLRRGMDRLPLLCHPWLGRYKSVKRTVAIIGLGLVFVAAHHLYAQTEGDIMRHTADCIDAYHADNSQDASARYLRCLARVQDEEDDLMRRIKAEAHDASADQADDDSSPTLITPADFAQRALSLMDTCKLKTDSCRSLVKAIACKADSSLCAVDDMNVLRVKLTAIIPKQPTADQIEAWAKKVSECHCNVPMPDAKPPAKPDSKPDTTGAKQ